jgi:signal peptidase II
MRVFWLTSVLSGIVSVITAVLVDQFLTERISLIGDYVGFERAYNPGVAFGIEIPGIGQPILILFALFIVLWIALRSAKTSFTQVAFGLIIGGGVANVIDRIPDGLVTDMIQIGTFPTFNIADSCISIGATILLWEMILRRKQLHRSKL